MGSKDGYIKILVTVTVNGKRDYGQVRGKQNEGMNG